MANRRINIGSAASTTVAWVDAYICERGVVDERILVHARDIPPASTIVPSPTHGGESIGVVEDTVIAATALRELRTSSEGYVLGVESLVRVEGMEIFRPVGIGERNVCTVGGAFGDESCVGDVNNAKVESGGEKNERGVHG